MLLAESTWPEVEAYLARARTIIIPIGSTEQHGPMGLIGTDAMCADAIARRAGDVGGFLVGPVLPVGMAQSHLGFPGTLSLTPTTLIAVVRDVVASLQRHGITDIWFLNGHGGNIATIQAAFAEIHAAATGLQNEPALQLTLASWFDLPGIRALLREMYPTGHGSHATPSEVAITQFLYPHAIKSATLEPRIAPDGGFSDAADFRRRYPDGRKGADSSLARPEDGERLLEAAAAALCKAINDRLNAGSGLSG
jgi:creatinine amidohydrolase